MKTAAMVLAMALVVGAGVACFGLYDRLVGDSEAIAQSCEGLEGDARRDCEQRQRR